MCIVLMKQYKAAENSFNWKLCYTNLVIWAISGKW
jgi:hypothetical protein